MTEQRLSIIVIEMLASPTRDAAYALLQYNLDVQCENWSLGLRDRVRLYAEIISRYEEAYKFFDKPAQSGT